MTRQARAAAENAFEDGGQLAVYNEDDGQANEALVKARPIPRISIQAFCEENNTAEAL
jgi:hypothetical protein